MSVDAFVERIAQEIRTRALVPSAEGAGAGVGGAATA
jgi:hypothetical protein